MSLEKGYKRESMPTKLEIPLNKKSAIITGISIDDETVKKKSSGQETYTPDGKKLEVIERDDCTLCIDNGILLVVDGEYILKINNGKFVSDGKIISTINQEEDQNGIEFKLGKGKIVSKKGHIRMDSIDVGGMLFTKDGVNTVVEYKAVSVLKNMFYGALLTILALTFADQIRSDNAKKSDIPSSIKKGLEGGFRKLTNNEDREDALVKGEAPISVLKRRGCYTEESVSIKVKQALKDSTFPIGTPIKRIKGTVYVGGIIIPGLEKK